MRQKGKHKGEIDFIFKMREFKDKGYSYWRIADVMNTMKIPTKTRKGKWHAKTVYNILTK